MLSAQEQSEMKGKFKNAVRELKLKIGIPDISCRECVWGGRNGRMVCIRPKCKKDILEMGNGGDL